jgi:radical SAM enzyme (TIGR01210 family)
MAENDLLIILNTKRCRYSCPFCTLPWKSSKEWIEPQDIVTQFEFAATEVKHALSIVDRVTLSNEGSVLDAGTLATDALLTIADAIQELRRVRMLVLETRLEFVDSLVICELQRATRRATVNILTGFETLNVDIRDNILSKEESLDRFLAGLDRVAECGAEFSSYVLFKPDPAMTDYEGTKEAESTIDFLANECARRRIPLTIRLNPMYLARGSKWGDLAHATTEYRPPRLTDVMKLAEKKRREGIRIYIGLSTEGLDEPLGTYMAREDYSSQLIGPVKAFNDGKIAMFDWGRLSA